MEERGQKLETQRKGINDSIFSTGLSLVLSRLPVEIESRDFSGKAFEVLQYLSEAEALTTSAVSVLLDNLRNASSQSLTCLWHAGLARWVTVATSMGIFKLWMASENRPPKDAMEACRMAALGIYYSRAKKEIPGFEWRIVRSRKKPVFAEMKFTPRGQSEKVKMVVDVPRRGEKLNPDANLYVLPTEEEAKELVPKGKKFTTDLYLLRTNEDSRLDKIIFETL